MTKLPDATRMLLGPGPSMTSPRVMRAMDSPTVSHHDPIMLHERHHRLLVFGLAALGPLAGKIWRVGLMGTISSARLLAALETTAVPRRQSLGARV